MGSAPRNVRPVCRGLLEAWFTWPLSPCLACPAALPRAHGHNGCTHTATLGVLAGTPAHLPVSVSRQCNGINEQETHLPAFTLCSNEHVCVTTHELPMDMLVRCMFVPILTRNYLVYQGKRGCLPWLTPS